ncbi:MAG: site-specific DNA-methyltransferase [Elusimicrobiota bacterium]|jgi:DNA modification methylase|nr:site-specific DNA-methyltransferase [Elusimicrobiota bacterium]
MKLNSINIKRQNFNDKNNERNNSANIKHILADKTIDHSWAFEEATRKDTTYITHGYHRYPAKFIPQIVSRLADKYTKEGDFIVDPFGGCGTTLVEAKVSGRKSVGVDINPVAVMIARVKTTPIEPKKIEKAFLTLKNQLDLYDDNIKIQLPKHERIDYWFREKEKKELAFILSRISEIKDSEIRDFFRCAFSNILKNCSIWLQKSNKPTRDFNKNPSEPLKIFYRQVKMMLKGNNRFFELLHERNFLNISSQVYCEDARKIPVKNNSVDLIISSPPYVTSYEYADLHQLTTLWFEYADNLSDFRKSFIGSAAHTETNVVFNSSLARQINADLMKQDRKTAKEVSTYFSEMNQVFSEMKRMLKKKGKTCIVIGNTSLKGVEILSAEVFVEQLLNLGFIIVDIIKRDIPSKNLPSIRDENTGKFASLTNKNKKMIYPNEYILIMERQ